MRPVHSFRIEPTLPASFADLRRVARNLRWTWDEQALALFAELDPRAWDESQRDPMRLLELITPERWAILADDQRIMDEVDAVVARLDDATTEPRWFQHREDSPLDLVAYFSPEFGLSETLAQYSGGLGILAGDHLKAAADLGVPLVGIGLLYREGYFHQRLDPDGWQNEAFPPQDPNGLAMTPTGLQISLEVGGEHVAVAIWRVDVGRIPLYLLDTGLPTNSPQAAGITDRLYGGDVEHRLRQEIVLGIGGVRALRALGLHPQVFHTNEGHAGFLSLERIREHIAGGLSFAEAVEAVRAGGVFTTHTPVPAGIDRFPPDLMQKYFGGFAAQCGIALDDLLAIGSRADEPGEHRFNMAVMGLRLASRSNGVAALHGDVSRHMFQGLWPDVPVDEVPIGSITNGVHAHTWVAPRIAAIFSAGIHPVWDGADARTWDAARKLDDATVWAARNQGRSEMVSFVRARLGDDLLDPDALTIGFSRRFATYKRATLLLAQADRLISILHGRDRPVQFVFAGKAHPADQPGKEMIREIELFGRRSDVRGRFVFVPDYDMAIARTLYHGADIWLNNPRRPLEACGTSGMKAALNGALNCSILDGWWDEAYDGMNGWAIDSAEQEPDIARRDEREAASLFGLLEQEIVPLFYDRRDGVPSRWLERVKHGWATIGPVFTASRMVRQYTTALYEPAAAAAGRMHTEDGAAAKALAAWKRHVLAQWDAVAVTEVSASDAPASNGPASDAPASDLPVTDAPANDLPVTDAPANDAPPNDASTPAGPAGPAGAGVSRHDADHSVSATVRLGGLTAADVIVQVVHGPLDLDGGFTSFTAAPLTRAEQLADGSLRYAGPYRPTAAGMYGCTVRVLPNHPDLTTPMELGRIAWA